MLEELFSSQKVFFTAVMRFGASTTLLYSFFVLLVLLCALGLYKRAVLNRVSISIDYFSSAVGKAICWAALLMVLQQVAVICSQSIFRMPEMSFALFGLGFTGSVSWFSEELRLYNAALIALASAFTLIQGGHVRVDLLYEHFSYRLKRIVDILGTLFMLFPLYIAIYFFGWGQMWKSVASASVNVERGTYKWRSWSFEASTNPSGFNEIWIYKILIVVMAIMMILQGVSWILKSLAELQDGCPKEQERKVAQHHNEGALSAEHGQKI